MKKLSSVMGVALSVALLLPVGLAAQITITSSDILKPVGYHMDLSSTDYGSHTVDLGSTGGPQTWDFTSYQTPDSSSIEIVNTSSTPFASDFPTSNFCLEFMFAGMSEENFQYTRVESGFWGFLGFGLAAMDTSFVQHYDTMGQIPLPISMGSSWVLELAYTDTIMGFTSSTIDRSSETVDAYGTMQVPGGSYQVLRVAEYDTTITEFGIPPFVFSDTTTCIGYTWYSDDPIFVAEVESQEDETNPNFTDAAWIEIAGQHGTGIGDSGGEVKTPRAFRLSQNTPNPFNPRTDISFTISEDAGGDTELSVFTLRGEKVRSILSGSKTPGTYTVSWDGRNDRGEALPSGIYLYRLTSGGESMTRKMVMAK